MAVVIGTLILSVLAASVAADAPCYPLVLNTLAGINSTKFGDSKPSDAVYFANDRLGTIGPNTNAPFQTTSTLIVDRDPQTLDISLLVTGQWNTDTQRKLLLDSLSAAAGGTQKKTANVPYTGRHDAGYKAQYEAPTFLVAKLTDKCGAQIAHLELTFHNELEPVPGTCNSVAASGVTDLIWDFLTPAFIPFLGLPLGGIIAALVTFGCSGTV